MPEIMSPKGTPTVTIKPPAPKPDNEPRPFTDFVTGREEKKDDAIKPPDAAPDTTGEKNVSAGTSEIDDTPPEVKSDAGRSSWQKLKEQLKLTAKERDEFKGRFETETAAMKAEREKIEKELLETKARFNPEELDRLKAEHGELWQKLRLKDVTELPEWKKRFVDPVERGVKHGVAQFPEEQRKNIEWLLRQPASEHREAALQEVAAELSSLKTAQLANALQLIDSTRQEAEEVLKDQQGLIEQHQKFVREEQERAEASNKTSAAKAFESVLAIAREKKVPIFSEIEGNAEHNKAVQAAVEEAKTYFSASDNEERAKLAVWAVIGTRMTNAANALKTENEQLKATIAKLQGATPKPGGLPDPKPAANDKSPFSSAVFGR